MSHADTLRDMAADQLRTGLTLLSAPHKTRGDALLAGAAALDTLDRVRDALTKIAQERERARARMDDALTHYDWGQEVGREHAYGNAYNIITTALGDTP